MAELANKIIIDLNTPEVLSINGQAFGYYLADEEIDVKVSPVSLGTVRLTLIAEHVEVIPKADSHG